MIENNCDYKRVLLVNEHSINYNNATAITLRSLWEDWPHDSLLELCFEEGNGKSLIGIKSIHISRGIINRIRKSKAGSAVNTQIKNQSVSKKKRSVTVSIRQLVVTYMCSKRGKISKSDLYEIDKFMPEVVYTLGGNAGVLKCAYYYARRYNIPIVIHFMDNWIEHVQNEGSILYKPFRRSLDSWLSRCLKQGKIAITISDSMAKAYSTLYPRIEFIPLMNSVDVESLICEPKSECGHPFVFTYAGGLHLDRWKSLLDIGKAIKEDGIDAVLKIYSSSDLTAFREEFDSLPVQFCSSVNHSEIKALFFDSDCLIHTESNNPELIEYCKYSISTKIPEYLASGRIMLFYGPNTIGLYKYLKDNQAAVLAHDYAGLKKAIMDIYQQNDYLQKVLEKGQMLARRNHSSNQSKAILHRIINEAN